MMSTDESSMHIAWRTGPAGRLGRVRHAGRIERGLGVVVRPLRSYDAYALMYLYRGSGVYRDAHVEQPLGAGSLVLVLPGVPHWYGPVGRSAWNEVHIVFEGDAFRAAHQTGLIDQGLPVRQLHPVDYWLPKLDGFRTVRVSRTRTGADEEVCDLLRLLVEIDNATEPHQPAAGGWLDESQRRLGEDLAARLDLAAVAAAIGMGYESWRKRFQAALGLPPARYRLHRRVAAAQELMRHTSLPGREIARLVGFTDEYHLSRQFRKVTGMTPTQFRH